MFQRRSSRASRHLAPLKTWGNLTTAESIMRQIYRKMSRKVPNNSQVFPESAPKESRWAVVRQKLPEIVQMFNNATKMSMILERKTTYQKSNGFFWLFGHFFLSFLVVILILSLPLKIGFEEHLEWRKPFFVLGDLIMATDMIRNFIRATFKKFFSPIGCKKKLPVYIGYLKQYYWLNIPVDFLPALPLWFINPSFFFIKFLKILKWKQVFKPIHKFHSFLITHLMLLAMKPMWIISLKELLKLLINALILIHVTTCFAAYMMHEFLEKWGYQEDYTIPKTLVGKYISACYILTVTFSSVGYEAMLAMEIPNMLFLMMLSVLGVGIFFSYETSGLIYMFRTAHQRFQQVREEIEQNENWLINLERLMLKSGMNVAHGDLNERFLNLNKSLNRMDFRTTTSSSFFLGLDPKLKKEVRFLCGSNELEGFLKGKGH